MGAFATAWSPSRRSGRWAAAARGEVITGLVLTLLSLAFPVYYLVASWVVSWRLRRRRRRSEKENQQRPQDPDAGVAEVPVAQRDRVVHPGSGGAPPRPGELVGVAEVPVLHHIVDTHRPVTIVVANANTGDLSRWDWVRDDSLPARQSQGRQMFIGRATAQVTDKHRINFSHEYQHRCEGAPLRRDTANGCDQRGDDWIASAGVTTSPEASTAYIDFPYTLTQALWTAPVKILNGGKWYPQVVGSALGTGTDKHAGASARFFMSGRSDWVINFSR